MGYQKIVINGANNDCCVLLISLILLLVTSSSATFNEIHDINLNNVPGVWRGIPEVTIETEGSLGGRKYYQICVDDTYWNTDIADTVCQYNGYQGCYSHTVTNPFFTEGVQADLGNKSVTILTCAEACSGSPYLGLTNNQDCICGSVLGDRSLVGVCDLGCQGDDLQLCGGVNAISVYGGMCS
ncbi:WSC domain-containing protein ARB_07870-like [Strongylocentrotus purpuratus]|uniref:WSC domain-containing protein n=1 Tax=Strongylocentrotus purpuratus TaxID=7668 RepID=A0A7M7N7B8_STRPU|nr:WSC domain-containing protein ARB_07870-like [Strongylocentrotus purpuratus]